MSDIFGHQLPSVSGSSTEIALCVKFSSIAVILATITNILISVASAALIIQNVCVALSALAVFFTIYFEEEVKVIWDGWMQTMCHIIIIVFANLAGNKV